MVDEHPAHGDAGLAAVERGPEPGGTRRQGQVGILQHEQGIATGQFQGGGNQRRARVAARIRPVAELPVKQM